MGTFFIVLVVALMALNIYYPQQQRPIKIKQRRGGIPIIDVTFNDKHKYEDPGMVHLEKANKIINCILLD
jgi:hypothetical protein